MCSPVNNLIKSKRTLRQRQEKNEFLCFRGSISCVEKKNRQVVLIFNEVGYTKIMKSWCHEY